MRSTICAFLAVAMALAPGEVCARTELTMQRTTPWVLRYDDKACDMAATFSHGGKQITATITAFSPQVGPQLTLAGDGMDWAFPLGEAKLGAGKGVTPRTVDVLSALGAGQVPMIVIMSAELSGSRERPDSIVDQLVFVAPSGRAYQLETGDLHDPRRVLAQCAQRLEQQWGFKPWEQEKLASQPRPLAPPSSLLRPSDYPERADKSGTSGYLRLRVNVSAQGKVTHCEVLRSIGPDSFGEAACRAVSQRARFDPARDTEGNAVASYAIFSALFT